MLHHQHCISARSGNDWETSEMMAFNIQVDIVNAQTFFGSTNLPQLTTVSPVILDNLDEPTGPLHKADMDFFTYMEDAMYIPPEHESFVSDFAAFVLKMMCYDEGRRVIHLRKEIPFEMCGESVDVKTDVCVMEPVDMGGKYLLLLQEDKSHISLTEPEPEPRLIAEAIAAFHDNNRVLHVAGLPPFQSRIFAGITMIGTMPTFYKIPVTKELSKCVATSQYPPLVTTVEKFIPPVRFPTSPDSMKPLANRHIILQCFEAFKQFVVCYSAY
ncbi:hypothetical protein BU17DRAFT_49786 [Hysterangium stoloniferum]|nr:hypothetical protein BU17DRAFT_49786 [Hysterangium stoloniferum]